MNFVYLDSPVGRLMLAADDDAVHDVAFEASRHRSGPDPEWSHGENALLAQTRHQLEEYFDGNRREFTLPLVAKGTPFQQQVWTALRAVPFGATTSYRDIAEQIGKPSALRAVGAANGRNPIPIIIPCHRVIGSNGTLTGFGGGLDVKAALLAHEQRFGAYRTRTQIF